MSLLSVIVPCYNEEKNIEKFFTEVSYVLKDIDINIIFVNDGSSDNTLNEIKKLILLHKRKRLMICQNTASFYVLIRCLLKHR